MLFSLFSCATGHHLGKAEAEALQNSGRGKKILMVVTSHDQFDNTDEKTGYWLAEVTHFYEVVTHYGYEVDFVSPRGGKPPMDERSRNLRDAANKGFLADPQAVAKLENSLAPASIKVDTYAAIYYAGGHGPMWDLPENVEIRRVAESIYQRGGVVAAVCHGPSGILNLRTPDGKYLIEGRRVTGFSNTEERLSGHKSHVPFLLENEMKRRGSSYHSALAFTEHVEVSDRLVTGQNPRSTRAVAEELVRLLHQPEIGVASAPASHP